MRVLICVDMAISCFNLHSSSHIKSDLYYDKTQDIGTLNQLAGEGVARPALSEYVFEGNVWFPYAAMLNPDCPPIDYGNSQLLTIVLQHRHSKHHMTDPIPELKCSVQSHSNAHISHITHTSTSLSLTHTHTHTHTHTEKGRDRKSVV